MSVIVRVAAQGDGVTEDGQHVPLAAPGDEVLPDGTLARGPRHQTPPCRHFPECGGCQLQHLDDRAFADYLVDRIVAALRAQRIEPPPIARPHLSPPNSRRRATLRAERRGRQVLLGFNEEKSHRIINMRGCHVIRPELFTLVEPLRQLLAVVLHTGARASVTMTIADQGVDLLLAGPVQEALAVREAISAFAIEHALARLSLDDGGGPQCVHQPGPVTITLGGVPVALPEGAFLQATVDGEAALQAAAGEAVAGASRIVDLFAGLGTFALPLRAAFAVEGSRDAAAALLATRRCQVAHRDLFRRPLTAAEVAPFDAVVLDPPRTGAIEQVKLLGVSAVHRIAYVSCNPSTFARDAAILIGGGYRLEHITPVGQFRWATHVELVGRFSR